ncbi:uncharacterized protein [Antedon mediterranea]|uniref:uncharacterized protein n=1 Tax=Antedon mediterranea TaxID=105859 RepID=UPI003AF615D9
MVIDNRSTCLNTFQACPGTTNCIPEDAFCDRVQDCVDYLDENEAACGPCNTTELRCDNALCIDKSLFCDDNINDCPDNYDETATICDGSCAAPQTLAFGNLLSPSVQRSRYLENQVFIYECYSGRTLEGNSTLICQDGTIQGIFPSCLLNCDKPADFENGEWVAQSVIIANGDFIEAVCGTGYMLDPPTPTEVQCLSGIFSPAATKRCQDVNECLADTFTCPDQSTCSNTVGSYICNCNTGYILNVTSEICEDIDECEELTFDCFDNSYCENTEGSYNCICIDGYEGDGTFCAEILYYPSGIENGDEELLSVGPLGELVSRNFIPRFGFPYGGNFLPIVYFTENGIFVLVNDDEEKMSYPRPSSTQFQSFDLRNIISVFWTDGDLSSDIGNVFFREYTTDTTEEMNFIEIVKQRLIDLYQEDVPLTFSPTWVLKVTWVNIPQRPVSTSNDHRNTFQAILLTDGQYSFAMFFFEERQMRWDRALETPADAIIGYNIPFFRTVDFQTQAPLSTNPYRPDEVNGNTGRKGQYAVRLEGNTDDTVNPRKRCITWYEEDRASNYIYPGNQGSCPCGLLLAALDGRYRFVSQISLNPFGRGRGTDINILLGNRGISSGLFSLVVALLNNALGSYICLQSSTFNRDLSGTECCYRLNGFSLIEGYQGLGFTSYAFRYGYTFGRFFFVNQYIDHVENDIMPQYYCCYESRDNDLCGLYFERRPAVTCENYFPPFLAWLFGDPHITTLDGLGYTFNGKGEFLCVDVANGMFQLQCRMSGVISDPTTKATIFSAFVGSHTGGESNTFVQFTLNANGTDIELLVNGTIQLTIDDIRDGYTSSEDPGFSISYSEEKVGLVAVNRTYATWSTDLSFGVAVNQQMLDIVFNFDEKYRTQTSGLFGVWNGLLSDEVCTRYGNDCLNATNRNLTESEIFDYAITWNITEDESAFVYPDGQSFSDFNDPDFQPVFLDVLQSDADPTFLQQAEDTCEGNKECLFDALATNSLEIGMSTRNTEETNLQDQTTLENIPPVLNSVNDMSSYSVLQNNYQLYVLLNRTVRLQVSASDENDDILTYSTQMEYPEIQIDNSTGLFTWTPTTVDNVNITIEVSDGAQSVTITMEVYLCGCVNGGQCDFTNLVEGSDINNDKFAVVQCICSAAWTGFDCSIDYDACMDEPCHPGVICQDNLAPEVNATCADCPSGLQGDGFKCFDFDECAAGQDQVEGVNFCEHPELCVNTLQSYTCNCRSGFELHPNLKDCLDIDECDRHTDNCDSNAMCENFVGGFNCSCNVGYSGDGISCEDVNECQTGSFPCDLNADCNNVVGSFSCACQDGFLGNGMSCDDINECLQGLSNCDENADCVNVVGSFMCTCQQGYQGNGTHCFDVNECVNGDQQCSSRGFCTNVEGSYTCQCNSGAEGDGFTCVDIDECTVDMNICSDIEECINTDPDYFCRCIPGYARANETAVCTNVDECVPVNGVAPCSSSGTCNDIIGSYECECNSGYMGDGVTCVDIDECSLETDGCSQTCANTAGSFTCGCNTGFELQNDTVSCNPLAGMECTNNPCDAFSQCILDNSGNPTCTCNNGYVAASATTCQNIDECASSNTNQCETNCIDNEGSFECSCNDGYELSTDERTCQDTNECLNSTICVANAECINMPGTFMCSCLDGFAGEMCDDINECNSEELYNCTENAVCINQEGSYRCACGTGFSRNDENICIDNNECLSIDSCNLLATCNNTVGSFECQCITGYTGDGKTNCTNINECLNSPCNVNAECQDTDGSYLCTCNNGYRGDGFINCANIDECFEQFDDCHELATCTDNNGSYTCECNMGFEDSSSQPGFNCTDIDECAIETDTCDSIANCTNTFGSYTCNCYIGYVSLPGGNARIGQCEDYDECDFNIDTCSDNGICSNTIGSYSCACQNGYQGDGFDCENIDECRSLISPCHLESNERCVDTQGSFYCTCQTSYFNVSGTCIAAVSKNLVIDFEYIEGLDANMFFDDFNFDDVALQISADMDSLFEKSIYMDQYFGTETISFMNVSIGIRATFIVTFNIELNITDDQLRQVFLDGLTGRDSNILEPDSQVVTDVTIPDPVIDHCFEGTDDCRERLLSVCVFTGDDMFECNTCYDGYEYNADNTACIDNNECDDNPCSTNEICNNTVGSFTCDCITGFVRNDSNICIDDNECDDNPCSTNEVCENTVGGFTCDCDTGFERDSNNACIDINECDNDPCPEFTTCSNTMGSYVCNCATQGFISVDGVCVDNNECDTISPCSTNEVCNNTIGSYTCECDSGYERDGNNDCVDDDECDDMNTCSTNEVCNNTIGSYTCDCATGYVRDGSNNCIDYNECDDDPCSTIEVCVNTDGSYTCNCDTGYERDGNNPCIDINECATLTNPCGANEDCTNTIGSYTCTCSPGFVPSTNGGCLVSLQYRGELRVIEVNGSADLAQYVDDLMDSSTELYQSIETVILAVVDDYYSTQYPYTFYQSSLVGFKDGSIIAVYLLDFLTNSTEQANQLLQDLIMSSTEGVITLDDGRSVTLDVEHDAVGEDTPIVCDDDLHCNGNGDCTVNDLLERVCSCFDGFSNETCDACYDSYCNDKGTCSVNDNTRTCTCLEGYEGTECQDETSSGIVVLIIVIVSCVILAIALLLLIVFIILIRRKQHDKFQFRSKQQGPFMVRNPTAGIPVFTTDFETESNDDYSRHNSLDARMRHLAGVLNRSPYLTNQVRSSTQSDESEVSSNQFMRPYVATGMEASTLEGYTTDGSDYDERERRNRYLFTPNTASRQFYF